MLNICLEMGWAINKFGKHSLVDSNFRQVTDILCIRFLFLFVKSWADELKPSLAFILF